jgi:hypothetical protein
MQRDTPPPRLDHEPLEEDDSGALVTRVGTVFGAAACAVVVATIPTELRVGDGGSTMRALQGWLALSALLLPVAVVIVGVLRRARVGLQLLAGERLGALAAGVLWWCVLEAGILSVFGAVLRAKTHHHGLAGVTFALFAVGSGVFSAFLAVRGAKLVSALPPVGQRLGLAVAAGAAFIVLMLVGIRTARAEGLQTASALVDVLALVVSCALASARPFARVRPLAILGVPAAAMIMVIGLATLRASPELQTSLVAAAPVQRWILAIFSR